MFFAKKGRTIYWMSYLKGVKNLSSCVFYTCFFLVHFRLEQKRVIEEDILFKAANILHISPEIIQKLEENPTSIVIENNTFQTGSSNVGVVEQQRDNIVNHPVDQLMELNKEQASLYERMLALEKEKNALLEKLLKEK